jgi:peptidoglycan/xylan/chitin deacetylase (PgdA/CDA1 family)
MSRAIRSEADPVTTMALPLPAWPENAPAAVSLTFDLDAEAASIGTALDAGQRPRRLSRLSAGTFGVTRGLPRVLEVLDAFDVRATFYVPGVTVQLHPGAITALAAAGHELAHHGHAHRRTDRIDRRTQREELVRGIEAHESVVGRPRGYRAPGWELTAETFGLLAELGFEWDSSMMGDDRPYMASAGGARMLELPVHWALDDWPYLGFDGEAGQLVDPRVPLRVWRDEFAVALEESRHVTYTMHPEVIGRGHRISLLRDLLASLREQKAAFLTHGDLAAISRQAL